MKLSVEAGSVRLKNPVMTAAGTFPELEADKLLGKAEIKKLGAIVTKTVTLKPRTGNPQPRIAETPCGMINSIGLENEGVDKFLSNRLKKVLSYKIPVIVSIAGFSVSEFAEIAKKFRNINSIAALEVNISCPNVKAGGAQFGLNPKTAADVISKVKSSVKLPVFVKLPPSSNIKKVALAVERAGASALVIANTLPALAFIERSKGKYITGGLSGPALKPHTMFLVRDVVSCVRIPVIACGGIMTGEDVLQYLTLGAKAVQVGTATLINPDAAVRIVGEFEELLKYEKLMEKGK
ncbi:MAG: dihydroorotate dehydrogenase [Planctomycetota bacterium]